jgi:hypothetical protein
VVGKRFGEFEVRLLPDNGQPGNWSCIERKANDFRPLDFPCWAPLLPLFFVRLPSGVFRSQCRLDRLQRKNPVQIAGIAPSIHGDLVGNI